MVLFLEFKDSLVQGEVRMLLQPLCIPDSISLLPKASQPPGGRAYRWKPQSLGGVGVRDWPTVTLLPQGRGMTGPSRTQLQAPGLAYFEEGTVVHRGVWSAQGDLWTQAY